jgi:hypothetical protein
VNEGIVLAAVVPVIAVMALVGGVTRGHRKHRLALAAGAVVCILWVAIVVALGLSSS